MNSTYELSHSLRSYFLSMSTYFSSVICQYTHTFIYYYIYYIFHTILTSFSNKFMWSIKKIIIFTVFSHSISLLFTLNCITLFVPLLVLQNRTTLNCTQIYHTSIYCKSVSTQTSIV